MTPSEALEAAYNEIAAANPDQKFEPFKKDYISYQVSVRAMRIYEKYLWNEAIRKATNEMFLYDGVIQDKEARTNMRDSIRNKLSYKIHTKQNQKGV